MSRWFRGLNAEQKEAVATIEGPLLVLAGAGSGKTRVITHRIAHMLEQGIAARNILAVTFTNKAAGEMRERLAAMVGHERACELTLSTFHSLGLQMLRAEAARSKRGARFTIFDAGDQLSCLREIARRVRLERSFDLGSLLSRISALKNDFVAADATPHSEDEYDQAAALLYPYYLEQLEAFAAVDFDDLVCKPTAMMERSADCRRRWADRYRYVLVDEYQDTNGAQMRMLRAIAGEHRNLCVVGDDDQAIYGWRGADVKNILRFERHFPGAKVVSLESNYRSVPEVLELANAVIVENVDRHKKTLRPTRPAGTRVKMVVTPDGEAEAAWVAARVREVVTSGRYRPADVAVLYRSNIVCRALEQCMREQGIDYRVLGGTSMYERKELKDVAAYLKLCANPYDEVSLRRVINTPSRGIGTVTIAKLARWSEEHGKSMFVALGHAEQILGPADRALAPIGAFLSMIKRNAPALRKGRALRSSAQKLIDESGLRADVEKSSSTGKVLERRWAGVSALLDGMQRYCERAEKPTLRDFLARNALLSNDDEVEQQIEGKVTLCTLHSAKGLEFPLVLLMGMEDGLLPHDRTLNPHQNDHVTSDLAEERRLCYVGITRARDELILTRARERMVRGTLKERPVSRFLEPVAEHYDLDDLSAAPEPQQVASMMAELRARWGAAAG